LKHLGIDPLRFRHKRNADLLERTDPGSRPRLVPLPASRRPSMDSCPCPMFLVLGLDPWLCHPHLRDVGYRCVCCQDLDPTIGIFSFPQSLVSGDPRGGGQDASPPPSPPSFVRGKGAGGYGSRAFRGGGEDVEVGSDRVDPTLNPTFGFRHGGREGRVSPGDPTCPTHIRHDAIDPDVSMDASIDRLWTEREGKDQQKGCQAKDKERTGGGRRMEDEVVLHVETRPRRRRRSKRIPT